MRKNEQEENAEKLESRRKPTGPRTTAGKERCKYNALKTGLFAKGVLLREGSRGEFDSLLKGLHEDPQPQGVLETACIEGLDVYLWRLQRCRLALGLARDPFKCRD